jgi:hypothetical protein
MEVPRMLGGTKCPNVHPVGILLHSPSGLIRHNTPEVLLSIEGFATEVRLNISAKTGVELGKYTGTASSAPSARSMGCHSMASV